MSVAVHRINLGRHTATNYTPTIHQPTSPSPMKDHKERSVFRSFGRPTLPCKPICSFRSADLFLMVRLVVVGGSGWVYVAGSHQKQLVQQQHPPPAHKSAHNNHKIVVVLFVFLLSKTKPTNQPPTLKPQNPIPGPKSNIVSSAQSRVAIAEHQELAIKKPQNAYLFTLKGRPNIDQLTFSYLKQFLCQPPSTPCMCGSHANEHPSANILASTQVLTKHITYSWGPLEGILLVFGCSFKFI